MKWITNDGHRYAHQLFHHMVISKTGLKRQETTLNDLRDVDFRNIHKQLMIKRLRKHLLENPNEADPKKWKISKRKIGELYPNALQFVNENGVLIYFNDGIVKHWLINLKLDQYVDDFVKNGYDTMDKLIKIDNESMVKIGIDTQDHRKTILCHIKEWDENPKM